MNNINNQNDWQIIILSANTAIELEHYIANILRFIKQYPELNLFDIAYVLNLNQQDKKFRFFAVANDTRHLATILETADQNYIFYNECHSFEQTEIIYMFPGQGNEYHRMGKELYETRPGFKKYFDECNEIIKKTTGIDIVEAYYYAESDIKDLPWKLRSLITYNMIVAIEYSIAKFITDLGIQPHALIGYSIGEVVAALFGEALSLDDAFQLVTLVAKFSDHIDDGALLVVKISANELAKYLDDDVCIASIHSIDTFLIGGKKNKIQSLSTILEENQYFIKKLNIPCAYHTKHMHELTDKLAPFSNNLNVNPTKYPIYSSCFGRRILTSELTSPDYWAGLWSKKMDLVSTFSDCYGNHPNSFYVEVGPATTMANVVKKIIKTDSAETSLLIPGDFANELFNVALMLGKAWLYGAKVRWQKFYEGHAAKIGPMPKSPFETYKNDIPKQLLPVKKSEIVLPTTEKEKIIYSIFQRVLNYKNISIYDDFFNLGGDSLLAMQCIAMLNEYKFGVNLNYFFNNPTIAALTRFYNEKTLLNNDIDNSEEIPLTPLQVRFFKKPKHWSEQKLITILLHTPEDLDISSLKLACQALLEYHDALRLRYVHKNGAWHQFMVDYEAISFNNITLPGVKDMELEMEVAIAYEQSRFDLENGPLIKFSLITSKKSSILAISFHHLCIDGFSIGVLVKNLTNFYSQLKNNATMIFPKRSTSFRRWANYLQHLASKMDRNVVSFWEEQTNVCRNYKMPVDFVNNKINMASATRELTFYLSESSTYVCLRNIPNLLNGIGILEILLLACAMAYHDWAASNCFFVDLRSHGRNIDSNEIDLSRTVGWLTIVFPFVVAINKNTSKADMLYKIQKSIKSIPNNGLSYGILRYLVQEDSIRERMEKLNRAEIAFNYHGQLDNLQQEINPFSMCTYPIANSANSTVTRSHLINIDAMIIGKQLKIILSYSLEFHKAETIKKFGDSILQNIQSIVNEFSHEALYNLSRE
jgi:non-ribosomal peptide synthase protein (TIGR01720 family)